MVLSFLLLALLVLTSGCASFTTDQKDTSEDPKTGQSRTITTRAKATTFIAGKSALANWKASQTDKTQGASVGSLSQESDSASFVKALTDLLNAAKPPVIP